MKQLFLFLLLVVLMSVSVHAALEDDLQILYKFEGNTNDDSGNGNDGDVTGTEQYAPGYRGQGFDFNGLSLVNSSLNGANDGTMCAWAKTDTLTPASNAYVYAIDDATTTGFAEQTNAAGRSYTDNNVIDPTMSFQLGTFYHVCLTWTASGSAYSELWINGTLAGNTSSYDGTIDTGADVFVGSCRTAVGTACRWDGVIDDFAYWDRKITPAEVNELYTTGFPGNFSITAKEYFTDAIINNFNVTVDGTTYATTTGQVITGINSSQGAEFDVTLTSPGYVTRIYTAWNTSSSLAGVLYPNNNVDFNFVDEVSLEPVLNVSYQVIGVESSTNYVTNGTGNLSGLPTGEYEIRYGLDSPSNNFTSTHTERSYFVTIPLLNSTLSNLTLYMLNESDATSFVVTVTNKNNQPVEGLTASLLRRFVEDGSTTYQVVEMMKPSVALGGSSPFSAVANTVPYLFRVQNAAGTILFQGSGQTEDSTETLYLIDDEIFIKVNTQASPFKGSDQVRGVSSSLTFTNTTGTFSLSYSDSALVLSQMCLKIIVNGTIEEANKCSSANSGVIQYTASIGNSTYAAYAIAKTSVDDRTYVINLFDFDNRITDGGAVTFGLMGLFILLITLILVGTAFASKPAVAVLLAAMAFLAFGPSMLGLVTLGLVLQNTVVVIAIILLWVMNR
jgi:hypothetical protein